MFSKFPNGLNQEIYIIDGKDNENSKFNQKSENILINSNLQQLWQQPTSTTTTT